MQYNKQTIIKLIKEELPDYKKATTMTELFNMIDEFLKGKEDIEVKSAWVFQSEEDLDVDTEGVPEEEILSVLIEGIKNNLDVYCNMYIEVEGIIFPYGISDIWIKFKLEEESKKIILSTLDDMKKRDINIDYMCNCNELIDTFMVNEYDILDSIKITNIEIS